MSTSFQKYYYEHQDLSSRTGVIIQFLKVGCGS